MKKFLIISALLILPFNIAKAAGGRIYNFDANPKTINAGQQIRVTLNFTIIGGSPSAFMADCGITSSRSRRVTWTVYEKLSNGQKRGVNSGTGNVTYDPYALPYPPYRDASYNVSPDISLLDYAGRRELYAELSCITNTGPYIITTSAPVSITQNASGNTGGSGGSGGTPLNPGADFSFPNPLQSNTIWELFDGIIALALYIAIPIAVTLIVYSGVLLLGSRGNPGTVGKARTIITWTVVGLVVLLIGKGFLTLISSILDLANG